MRTVPRLAVAFLCLASHPAFSEEPAKPAETPQVTEKTEVEGNVPRDIVGRWFVVSQYKLPTETVSPAGRLFEIRSGPVDLEVVLRRAELPQSISQKLREAAVAGKPWTPTDADLQEIAQGWDTLVPIVVDYLNIESKILGADKYPREFQVDKTTKDSRFAITIHEELSGNQPVRSTYSVFGVRQQRDGRLEGGCLMTMLAAAPFPLPITLKGDFQAYRVGGEAPAPSWWRRLLDGFAGCGRS